ncbi:MAG: OsmC family protein [Bacteroidia bacterium]
MKAQLTWLEGMHLQGVNEQGHVVDFDSSPAFGGKNKAPRPMEVFLQAMMACTAMDVISILRKKRKTVTAFRIEATAKQAEDFPHVFTHVHLIYLLQSPDAELHDLNRSIELSQEKYCSASAMFRRSGCSITWEAQLM